MIIHTYSVAGMTCGHCVGAVTDELKQLSGISEVNVDPAADDVSTVTVTSELPIDKTAVAAALEEAGDYKLVS